jgi:hypothetical protein
LDVSQNYATFGFFCSRNSRQVLKKEDLATCTISEDDVQQLQTMYTRANDLAMRVLPTELLRGLRAAHQLIQWPTMETNRRPITDPALHTKTTTNLWAGAAVSMNYVSATHVDSDFFYSMLTVVCHDDKYVTNFDGKHYSYRPELPPAVHFCLPKKNIAIPLRPGDYILFNPSEPHCVSMRDTFYQEKNVFLLSFYLKSAIVGRNDNTLSNDNFTNCESLDYYFTPVP